MASTGSPVPCMHAQIEPCKFPGCEKEEIQVQPSKESRDVRDRVPNLDGWWHVARQPFNAAFQ